MAFAFENDDLRREMRKGQATTFRFWPKRAGSNQSVSNANATIYNPLGEQVQGPVTLTPVDVDGVSRLDIAVTGIDELDEDYRVDVIWDGNYDSFQFDVVLYPWGEPSISLNDILEERPGAEEVLENLGDRLGRTAAEMAGIFAVRARVELDAWVRATIAADSSRYGTPSYTSTGVTSRITNYTRPYLILNRERMNRVERKLALRQMYAADMSAPDTPEESAALYEFYKEEADSAWRQIGPLKYARDESMIPDTELTDLSKSKRLRRVQG